MSSAALAGPHLMFRFRSLLGLGSGLILCVSLPAPAVAQQGAVERIRPTAAIVPFQLRGEPAEPVHRLVDTLDLKPSYWKEGGLIGAGVLGLSGLIVAAEFCGYSDTGDDDCTLGTIGGAVIGSALGFGVGALIGGMFPKPVPDSVTVAVPGAGPEPEAQGWSAGKIAATALLATGGAFLGGDLAGALGVIGGIGLGVFVGSRLP